MKWTFRKMDAETLEAGLKLLETTISLVRQSRAPKTPQAMYTLMAMELLLKAGSAALRMKQSNLRLVEG